MGALAELELEGKIDVVAQVRSLQKTATTVFDALSFRQNVPNEAHKTDSFDYLIHASLQTAGWVPTSDNMVVAVFRRSIDDWMCYARPATKLHLRTFRSNRIDMLVTYDEREVVGDAEAWDLVRAELMAADWSFRTIDGIARNTGLDRDRISRLLDQHGDDVRTAPIRDHAGRVLYTSSSRPRRWRDVVWEIQAALSKSL